MTSKRLEPTATANVKHSTSPDTVKNPSPLALASVPTAQDIMLGSQHRLGGVLKDKKNTVWRDEASVRTRLSYGTGFRISEV